MLQLLVTRAEFADAAGVTRAAVTIACQPGNALAPAAVGKRIDSAHPAAVAYLTKRNKAIPPPPVVTPAPTPHVRGPAAAKQRRKDSATSNIPDDIPANVADFLEMPLRELVARFGTDVRFLDWLKAAKVIEEISGKRYQNAELRGDLIPREFVQTHMVGAVEELAVRLLNDAPPTIATATIESVRAGRSKEEVEQEIQKIIGKQIQTAKAKIVKAVRNA